MRINFSSVLADVFSQYTTTDELKSAANAMCAQIKEAYEARFKELASKTDLGSTALAKSETKTKGSKVKNKPTEAPKTATETKKADESNTLVAITDLKAIKKLGLTFEKYSDKSYVLRGDTKPLCKILKEQFKGVFNSFLTGGPGWVIKNSNVEECAKALGIKVPKIA